MSINTHTRNDHAWCFVSRCAYFGPNNNHMLFMVNDFAVECTRPQQPGQSKAIASNPMVKRAQRYQSECDWASVPNRSSGGSFRVHCAWLMCMVGFPKIKKNHTDHLHWASRIIRRKHLHIRSMPSFLDAESPHWAHDLRECVHTPRASGLYRWLDDTGITNNYMLAISIIVMHCTALQPHSTHADCVRRALAPTYVQAG